jgi:hypothetical protein
MARTARCPICKQPTEASFRPFCSKRCADVDLARWLGGTYAIAATSDDADEDGETAHTGAMLDPASNPGKPSNGAE